MIKKLSHIMVGLMICLSLFGQTESEIQSKANELFKSEKFLEATPLYLRLLSLSPKNTDYNYRYGTCLLFNADKKQEALRYLKFATESPTIDPEAHFYIGKAYHLNYLFNDAVRSYNKYEELAGKKASEEKQIERLIETCQNGRRLLMNYSEMIVYDKKEIESDKFFRLYDTKEIGGTIIVTADYQTKLDKKMGHIPLVFFAKNATEIFYSSYGEDLSNGKQIYRSKRESTGKWGDPQLVKGQVNTKFDEDFCYKSQDGKYLYFSSKGHNSMGGYDVFRSEYNPSTDSFDEPENMDFAVSSPDDDIFFLVDAKNENGYFASARQSEVGKLYVYKIRVDKLPMQLSVIAGQYESKITQTPAQLKVQVETLEGKIIGQFKSDKNGQIVLSFPTGGQYRYKMNLEGSSEMYTANVNIPKKKDIKPMRQSFVHFMENGSEVVRVLDRFDETVSEKDDLLAALFAEKANLDPNADKFDLNSLNNEKEIEEVLASVGANGMTMNEVASEMEGKARSIRDMENKAGVIEKKTAVQIEAEIVKIEKVNKRLNENAEAYKKAEANSVTRQKLLEESKELLTAKESSINKINNLLIVNEKVQDNLVLYQDLKKRAVDWEKKGAQLQQLLKEDKNAEALQLIAMNKVIITSAIGDTVDDYQSVVSMEINGLDRELSTLSSRKFNYETSSKDLRNNIDYLERNLMEGKTQNPKTTKEQIALKKKDLIKIHDEIDNIESSLVEKREIKEALVDELSEYMALDNSPMPNNLAQLQEAENHWNQVKNTLQGNGADYLAEAIRTENKGGIATDPKPSLTKEELLAVVNPAYSDQIKSINNNADLSALDKAAKLSKIEEDNSEKLKAELQKTDQKLAQNPNSDALKAEKATLSKMAKDSEQTALALNNQLEKEQSKKIAESLNERMVLAAIDNTYDEVNQHINKDSNLDGVSKLIAMNEHNEAFISKVKVRQNEIQNRLSSEPNKLPEFQKELDLLGDILSVKENTIATNKSEIDRLKNVASTKESAFSKLSAKEQEMAILTEVNRNYLNQKESFEDNSNPSKDDLLAELTLDNSLVADLDKKLSNIHPQNQVDEKRTIQRLKNDLLADIAQNEKRIQDLESQVAIVDPIIDSEIKLLTKAESSQELIDRVARNYTAESNKLIANQGQSELNKTKAQVALDEALVSNLSKEKSKITKLASENPDIESLSIKEAQLDQIIAEKSQLMASRKDKIDELENLLVTTNPVNPASSFAQLDPKAQEKAIQEKIDWTYEEDKNEIAAISNSELEKVQGLIQLDKETQKKLATEKASLDPVKNSAEIKAITRIEKSIQESLSNNQMSMLALPESDDELISRIARTNTAKRESLYANTSLSELKWKEQEIELDQELLEILANEQEKFNRLGADNPQVPELKDKADEIAKIISRNKDLLARHEGQRKSIAGQLAVTDPITDPIIDPVVDNSFNKLSKLDQEKNILQSLDPAYNTKKDNLSNVTNPTRTQIEEGLNVDKKMLSEISTMKNNLDPVKDATKIEAISRIEQKTNQNVNRTELALTSQQESNEAILTRLVSTELGKIQEIKNSSTLSELDKAQKIQQINTSIIRSLENEKSKVDNLSQANPSVENLSKKSFALASIIGEREAQIAILDQEISKINSDLAATNSINKLRKGFITVEELRTEVLKGDNGIVQKNETTIAGLNEQLKKLETYEQELIALDSEYEYYEESQGANFEKERQVVASELGIIGTKKRQASVSIGQLETEAMGPTIAQTNVKYNDAALTKLVKEENDLRVAIESDDLTSMKEARKLEKKLLDVIGDRMDKENSITTKIVNNTYNDNEDKLKKLKSLESNSITEKIRIELTEKRYQEISNQSKELEQKAKKSNSPVEQAELLSQALSKQQEASDLLEMSYVDTKIENLTKGKINSLMTNGELEMRKRNLVVEEANNAAQLSEIETQIKNETNAKKQDKLYERRDELVKNRSGLIEEIAQVDKKISKAPKAGAPTLPDNAKSKELTYLEEREIAESKVYKDLSRTTYDAKFIEKEIFDLLISIDQDKIDAQHLVELSLTNNDKDIDKLVLKKIESIKEKELKVEELKIQLKKRQDDLKQLMPTDPNTIAKVNNLLARSVDPMTKGDAVDYVAIPDNGFEILAKTNTPPVVKAKPIAAETPTGLMYRVQVGAFSKPVSEDQFNEFTPVSAEKRSNGILVYMAGYFIGNLQAFEAQKSIRKIGYSDAFVVAYCDGKRITLSEAKRLEETKACTPIEFNQISIQNNAPAPTDTTKIMVTELDYYKAIGAAPAFPVETKKGLFFTVQLGVYNRPVDKMTLKDMSPLITKRLPNGQIRYSAGVYVSVEEAFPKRDQAFQKGISDAYITAYYNGERITLTEAEDLLRKEGTGVIEKTATGIVKDVDARLEATKKLDNDIQEIVKNKMVKGMNIQLVSKNQYNEFPRDVLNRFNSHASFYYDINDNRIKSNLYSRIDDIPQVYFLRNEIDTTYITDKERLDRAIKNDLRNVSFQISSAQMEGDLSDMLLRLNYRKEFVLDGESIEVILHEVPPAKVQNISDRLRTLKIRAEVVDPAQ